MVRYLHAYDSDHTPTHINDIGRGRGRVQGRGRGRGRPPLERESSSHHEMEVEPSSSFEPSNKPSLIQVPNVDDDPNKIDPMMVST